MHSIFPDLDLDRSKIKWEDYLTTLTPVEKIGDMWFKRDDAFAPLGLGFINGTKVRQGIYLFNKYVKGKKHGWVGGMSIHSPQHSMQSVVAKHYNELSYHVIGATNPIAALHHEDIAIAAMFGSHFKIINIAYNNALQKEVERVAEKYDDLYRLGYAISLDHRVSSPLEIAHFHDVSAAQVKNIPDHIENLIIPTGSGNSVTSILWGIAKWRPKNLRNVYMIGIGPQKLDFIEERLDIIEDVSGVNSKPFRRFYPDNKDVEEAFDSPFREKHSTDYNLIYEDLHKRGIVKYGVLQPESYETISFHDNYEGKVWRYIKNKYGKFLINDKTLMWVVGNKPSIAGLKKESSWEKIRPIIKENVERVSTFDS